MTIAWILLTMNRAKAVGRTLEYNTKNAGMAWDELIWVDNGSREHEINDIVLGYNPTVCCLFKKNQGVAIGYNTAMSLARSDLIVITGCDMLMPDNWLRTFVDCFEKIPNTGVVSIYSVPCETLPERLRGPERIAGGITIRPAMPMGRKAFSRELLKRAGWLREDFGLYGHEDVEFGYRMERVCREKGLLSYVLPQQVPRHLGDEDPEKYRNWKLDQAKDPEKIKLLNKLISWGHPYYSPY